MIAIPVVDLQASGSSREVPPSQREGRARRTPPSLLARELADLGFCQLYVDGVGGTGEATVPFVEYLLRDTSSRVQVGGVMSSGEIDQLLRAGAECVVVGDRGIEEPDWFADVAELYPDAIAVTTDVRDRRVVRRGWVRTLPVDILDLVDELNALPLRELLINIRPLDGAMRFSELSILEDVSEHSRCPVFVAGGVTSIHDLRALEHRGIAGAMIDAEKLLGEMSDRREIARDFGG